jgi:hypothetical protein
MMCVLCKEDITGEPVVHLAPDGRRLYYHQACWIEVIACFHR